MNQRKAMEKTQDDVRLGPFAPILLRAGAFVIDVLLTLSVVVLAHLKFGRSLSILFWPIYPVFLLGLIIFYFCSFESGPSGATVGESIIGLEVTDLNGRRISFGRALARFLGFFLLGYFFNLLILFSERKQSFQDLLLGTVVRRTKQRSLLYLSIALVLPPVFLVVLLSALSRSGVLYPSP